MADKEGRAKTPRFPDDFETGDVIDMTMSQVRYALSTIEAVKNDLNRALATLEALSVRHARKERSGADAANS